jgi:PAS domain S-box-containing protein
MTTSHPEEVSEIVDLFLIEKLMAKKFKSTLLDIKQRASQDLSMMPIIVGLPPKDSPTPWLKAGFDDVILLPFNKELLATRLEVWLHIREESRLRFRALYENATLGLYRTTPEGKILLANPALVNMLGYDSLADLMKRNLETEGFEPGYDRAAFRQRLERDGVIRGLEAVWQRKDGSSVYIRESAKVIKDPNGNVLFYEGTVEDITERKRVEEALKTSEEMFRDLYENAPNAYLSVGIDGKILRCNHRVEELLGYTTKELLGRPVLDLYADTPHGKTKAKEVFERFKIGEIVRNEELQMQKVDSSIVWISLTVNAIKDTQGQVTESRSILVDITERKQAEIALKESEERWRFISQATQEGILLHDQNKIVDINETGARLVGYTREELIGQSILSLTHPDSLETVLEKVHSGSEEPYEAIGLRKDGSTFPCELLARNMVYHNRPVRVVVIRDLTMYKRAEEIIKKSLEEKEILLKEIHHRVKNNLQVISSLLNLQVEAFEDQHVRKLFNESRDRIRSMALVHESLYKSEDYSQVNFGEYLKRLTRQLFRLYQQSTVELEMNVSTIRLPMDLAIPCGLVVNELVTNALKHAFPQEQSGKITISFKKKNSHNLFLSVKDNGIGGQVESMEKKETTLGMNLVSILVKDQLKGTLKIKQNGGTHVVILFPWRKGKK